MATRNLSRIWIVCVAFLLAAGPVVAVADVPDEPQVPSCYGNGQVSVYVNGYYELDDDVEYYNLTIGENGILNTNGHVVCVRGTLTNYGLITDSSSGGAGGSGGQGGDGGWGFSPHHPPTEGADGGDSSAPAQRSGAGDGGAGGGGGGGGGGAWNTCPSCMIEGDVWGGDGGNGAAGGRGGGYVRIYAYYLDNRAVIHADGEDGDDGHSGQTGRYREYWCIAAWRDAASGPGGGGGGGDGGDAGTVEVRYAYLINAGEIRANGGRGGTRGAAGANRCDELEHVAGGFMHWEHGAPGGAPGEDGCAWGGNGGASNIGTYCENPPARAGDDGCDGADGVVVVMRDANCNGVPDDEDIANGTSADCQPDGIPDECELRYRYVASGPLSPIGVDSPQSFVLPPGPKARGSVTLILHAVADLRSSSEYVDVYLNGELIGSAFDSYGHDCPEAPDGDRLVVSAQDFNAAMSQGAVVIDLVASDHVNPDLCDPPSYIGVGVHYSCRNDCNHNSTPDECDIAGGFSEDADGNGIPDECENWLEPAGVAQPIEPEPVRLP